MLSLPIADRPVLPEPNVVDLLLSRRELADAAVASPAGAARLLPRLVGVSVAGVAAYAVVQGTAITLTPHRLWPGPLTEGSVVGSISVVFLAYLAGLFGAQVAALPSAYFYGLLAGVKTHGWRIAVEAMRAQATSATVLLGLLPVYLAASMGVALADGGEALEWLVLMFGGYTLPFVAGLGGCVALVRNFTAIVRDSRVHEGSRSPMPVLLVLAWAVLFTTMAPLGVWRVLSGFGG